MASRHDTELLTEHFGYPPVVRSPFPTPSPSLRLLYFPPNLLQAKKH